MKVRQLSVATLELRDAIAWYHERSPSVAEQLWLRVKDARASIALFPCASPLIAKRVRRFVLTGFPYDVIYSLLADEIVILAFAHHSRRPAYWVHRLNELANK
jgi:plasmid stabilization system protein ParE